MRSTLNAFDEGDVGHSKPLGDQDNSMGLLSSLFGSRDRLSDLARQAEPCDFLTALATADIFVLSVPFDSQLDPETMTEEELLAVIEANAIDLAENDNKSSLVTNAICRDNQGERGLGRQILTNIGRLVRSAQGMSCEMTNAGSIVNAIETLVCPAIRPPAMASEINSGGFLERRIEMILSIGSATKPSSSLHFGVAALALFFMAQDRRSVPQRYGIAFHAGGVQN